MVFNPFLQIYSFNTLKKNALENIVEKGEIAQNEQFYPFPECFLCSLYLKSINSHISLVVCSIYEFRTVSKWCIKEWVKAVFNVISVSSQRPVYFHAFRGFFLPLLLSLFFPTHELLFHITIIETMNISERGMNLVELPIIIQSMERILAELVIKPATSCSQVLYTRTE